MQVLETESCPHQVPGGPGVAGGWGSGPAPGRPSYRLGAPKSGQNLPAAPLQRAVYHPQAGSVGCARVGADPWGAGAGGPGGLPRRARFYGRRPAADVYCPLGRGAPAERPPAPHITPGPALRGDAGRGGVPPPAPRQIPVPPPRRPVPSGSAAPGLRRHPRPGKGKSVLLKSW